ncbi:Amidohydrolase 1 [Penicillium hetheringtonii]|uniref:Amidohydrolase 1 n=1 Tax=Penicillium hetheringtonii TaxID=911720 RepID=A0AAD6GSI2_9EURO|nr:Amidohydrolase 1 [Penicillium hetheringtonii]
MDLSRVIKPWKLQPQKTRLFVNAIIIDPVHGDLISNASVKISGGEIIAVDTNGSRALKEDLPEEDIVDLSGKYLCPGLIDCHVHIAVVPGEADLRAYKGMTERISLLRQPHVLKTMLSRGFTSIRDCGGASLAMKEAVEEGVLPGPRMFIAGFALSQTGGHECYKFARDELRKGADFIKIMGGGGVASPTDRIEHVQFSDEEIKAIVTVAKNAGTYVTSHSYTPQAIQQAINLGVRGIEHGNLIDLETAKLMAEKGVFLTPTLIAHVMSKQMNFLPADGAAKNDEVLEKGLKAMKMAADCGVTVCFGSDLLGPMHFAQSKEFSVRSRVLAPLQILQSATINAARLVMQEHRLGQIREGFAADLLVLDQNPLQDITILDRSEETILCVIKDGRVYESRMKELEKDI